MSKKKGKTSKRPIALIALIIILVGANAATIYYFTIYNQSIPLQDFPQTISKIMENPSSVIGQIVTITGYYIIAAGFPMLVEDTLFFLNNSLQSDNHVQISGEAPDEMKNYLGQRCDVKGRAEWVDETQGTLAVRYSSYIGHESEVLNPDIYEDSVLDTSILEGLGLESVPEISMKYAVLYSGGWNETKAYYRYWNDIAHMYYLLRLKGYPADNIYVVYKDGEPCEYDETGTPVDYPATQTAMETVFQELNQTMTTRDSLFFYTTNHGGSSGISTYWPNGGDHFLNGTEVAGWLDSISCHHMIILMQQCFSYNFISPLSAPNRVIITSCSIGESGYGCDTEGQWDELSYHFMSAIIGYRLNGDGPAFADFIDADGRISMREAYLYAVLNNSWNVNFLYDDDGDGVGLWGGPVFFGSGFYGDNVFL